MNLEASDFHYKSLMVDDIWIPLGENILIERYRPVWNHIITGFGIKDPGNRRKDQHRSLWDVVHPGRKFANKLGENPQKPDNVVADLTSYFATGSVPKRLKAEATKGEDPGGDA